MSRQVWNAIMQSKFFYVRVYRKSLVTLFFSNALSLILILAIWIVRTHQTPQAFYATDGVTPPARLMPLFHPNESSEPLLPTEPVADVQAKPIPQ